jgi:hypothetical protein
MKYATGYDYTLSERTLQLFAVAIFVAAMPFEGLCANSNSDDSPITELTSKLPDCDQVVIDAITGAETRITSITATKSLVGKEATNFDATWRLLSTNNGFGDACHSPIYRFHFYKAGTLYAEATICFYCDNIYFVREHAGGSTELLHVAAINDDSKAARDFRTYLSALFPGHDTGSSFH